MGVFSMINSRDLNLLAAPAKLRVELFISACKGEGIDLLVTSTFRDYECQQALYNQGRTPESIAKGEKIVTKAQAGQSFHNFRCAVDVVPLVNGKPVWDVSDPIWARVGKLGQASGLEWAGTWVKFKETCHFQYTGGLTLKDLQEGKQVAVGV
jgi:peptidoglycan L-alanyl-D-glutamate endopeptidase CwlK